jgi:hypothetical protein
MPLDFLDPRYLAFFIPSETATASFSVCFPDASLNLHRLPFFKSEEPRDHARHKNSDSIGFTRRMVIPLLGLFYFPNIRKILQERKCLLVEFFCSYL